MDNIIEFKEWFVKNFNTFEDSLNGENTPELHRVRKEALKNFSELSLPTLKDEEWRYTNISPLLKYNFALPSEGSKISDELVSKYLFSEMDSNILIFVNGKFSKENSKLLNLPEGTIAGSISDAVKNNPEIIEKHFGKYASYSNQIFTALSTAYTKDGAFIYVPEGKIVENPIHIIFITTAFLSFISEDALETSAGSMFFAYFYPLLLFAYHDKTELNPDVPNASGAIISNIYDLKRYVKALYTGELISDQTHQEQINTLPMQGGPNWIQYGLGIVKEPARQFVLRQIIAHLAGCTTF